MSTESNNNEQAKSITIRGVDLELYENFTTKLKEYNMNVGEAFSQMMDDVLKNFDEIFNESTAHDYVEQQRRLPRLTIESHQELAISAKDLIDTKSKVSFREITSLKFDESVTKEIFLKHVRDIRRCGLVQFGKEFPRLIALAYCEDCDNVEFS